MHSEAIEASVRPRFAEARAAPGSSIASPKSEGVSSSRAATIAERTAFPAHVQTARPSATVDEARKGMPMPYLSSSRRSPNRTATFVVARTRAPRARKAQEIIEVVTRSRPRLRFFGQTLSLLRLDSGKTHRTRLDKRHSGRSGQPACVVFGAFYASPREGRRAFAFSRRASRASTIRLVSKITRRSLTGRGA